MEEYSLSDDLIVTMAEMIALEALGPNGRPYIPEADREEWLRLQASIRGAGDWAGIQESASE